MSLNRLIIAVLVIGFVVAGQAMLNNLSPKQRAVRAHDPETTRQTFRERKAARQAFLKLNTQRRSKARPATWRQSYRHGEFFFDEIENRAGGKDSFLMQHAVQQGLPASLNDPVLEQTGDTAWQAFRKVKFTGPAKGRPFQWQSIGPETVSGTAFLEPKNSSGRVTDLATGISCDDMDCRLYVATAGGGLWRSDRALDLNYPRWRLLNSGLDSNNIGSITVDENDTSGETLYVGTGESNFSFTSAAGKGLFKSIDGGESFTRVPTMITDPVLSTTAFDFTATRGISQVAIRPGEPETVYVATTIAMLGMTSVRGGQSSITGQTQARVGLYRTQDAGASWELLFEAPVNTASSPGTPSGVFEMISGVKDVQFDPVDPDTVYISVADQGLYRSSPALDGNTDFYRIFEVVGSSKNDSYVAFDLVIKDGTTRVYAYNGNSADQTQQALYRLDNANQPHTALFNGLANTGAWVIKSVFQNPRDYVDFEICRSQCVYDLVVASPEGRPDTVYLGGVATRSLGDSTIRSIDGGENFLSHAIDRQPQPGSPHVDVRSIVFSPDNPDLSFIGSDGGVVRTTGTYGNGTARCSSVLGIPPEDVFLSEVCQFGLASIPQNFVFMNHGLQTTQLYNVSADPNQPLSRIMAGTQDNSTQWHDGNGQIKQWTKVFDVGDGTSANGFHRENPNILFASYQSANFFTHFSGGAGGNENWYFTGGPIQYSDELQYPNTAPGSGRQFMTFDPLDPDTQFTGYEHIWRTMNNGGSRAELVANGCAFTDDFFKQECGDWVPLGPYLTRSNFGDDRSGGVIVAAERGGDSGSLWLGTSLGRVFVSKNVNAAPASVEFNRVDSDLTPPRFVSGIAVDPHNPNRAFISYSGFSAVTPEAPGHVFEVFYDGNDAAFVNIDFNLGDMPVNHLVFDDVTGDLYAATDFGVLMLRAGTHNWELAGDGLPVVLTPHLEIHPAKRMLFAATHGMGAWYLLLDKN